MNHLRYLDGAEDLVAPLLPRLREAEAEVLRLRRELAAATRERDEAQKAITRRVRAHYLASEIAAAKAQLREDLATGVDEVWEAVARNSPSQWSERPQDAPATPKAPRVGARRKVRPGPS